MPTIAHRQHAVSLTGVSGNAVAHGGYGAGMKRYRPDGGNRRSFTAAANACESEIAYLADGRLRTRTGLYGRNDIVGPSSPVDVGPKLISTTKPVAAASSKASATSAFCCSGSLTAFSLGNQTIIQSVIVRWSGYASSKVARISAFIDRLFFSAARLMRSRMPAGKRSMNWSEFLPVFGAIVVFPNDDSTVRLCRLRQPYDGDTSITVRY
jgi:hypothetical protein